MFIHPHHQFPSLSCESCLLFFWPKDFNYGWIGSKMSSVLFEGFWSLFLALHFFAFPLFPTPPSFPFVCVSLCVSTFAFYAASMVLLPPLSDFQVERFAAPAPAIFPAFSAALHLHFNLFSTRVLPRFPFNSRCISQLTTPRTSPLPPRCSTPPPPKKKQHLLLNSGCCCCYRSAI